MNMRCRDYNTFSVLCQCCEYPNHTKCSKELKEDKLMNKNIEDYIKEIITKDNNEEDAEILIRILNNSSIDWVMVKEIVEEVKPETIGKFE